MALGAPTQRLTVGKGTVANLLLIDLILCRLPNLEGPALADEHHRFGDTRMVTERVREADASVLVRREGKAHAENRRRQVILFVGEGIEALDLSGKVFHEIAGAALDAALRERGKGIERGVLAEHVAEAGRNGDPPLAVDSLLVTADEDAHCVP